MDKILGFIGTGNMAQSIIRGIITSGLAKPEQIVACDLDEGKLLQMNNNYGIKTTTDSCEAAEQAGIIILAVKPDVFETVIKCIKDKVTNDKIIVSVAAGKTLECMEEIFGGDVKAIRTMPNTPALVGEGMSALCPNKNVSEDELALIKNIFESFGKTETMPEKLLDAVTGISGSSPAFVYVLIEAMSDAGVLAGMPRVQAYKFAAQTVLGAAKMVLETDKHPGELKDMVCSPGGTTIEGIAALESAGFRGTVINGVTAAIKKCAVLTN